jgi:2-succinyl-5-enolpyruvyl-6-hydroxy-3-cyclohexene-1-carboxylate synthase
MKTAELNARQAESVVMECLTSGVKDAVISPGSRNTPLVMALSEQAAQGRVTLHTIIDERSAGFYALGLARMTGDPVLLSCTSGSAGAHYFPALVEANRSRIPLVAVTADRPAELQGCGAPQTMAQQNLYGGHVRAAAHLKAPSLSDPSHTVISTCRPLFEAALGDCPGPVHLNMAFRKPLWEVGASLAGVGSMKPAKVETAPGRLCEGLQDLVEDAQNSSRGLIVWGAGECGTPGETYKDYRKSLSEQVQLLSTLTGWPVVSDATAGIRESQGECVGHIGTADLLLRSERFRANATPDLVVRVGGEPTSKVVSEWLRDSTHGKSFLMDRSGWVRDPNRTARGLVRQPAKDAIESLNKALATSQPKDSTWLEYWRQGDLIAKDVLAIETTGDALWAGSIASTLNQCLPNGSLLHVASSLAIRSIVSFAPEACAEITYTANRGVNGIDGTLSTALGQASRWADGPTVVLLGDVAFHHDASALAYAPTDRPFLVVVVDNQGGGIFDHLPIASAGEPFERHFITNPHIDPVAIGSAYGLSATTVSGALELSRALEMALKEPGSHLIVAQVNRAVDLERHSATWDHGSRRLEGGKG